MKLTTAAIAITATAALFGGGARAAQAAPASSQNCSGAVTGRHLGDVVVPAGRTCTLTRSTVDGAVTVERGARLVADGVRISGAVTVQPKAAARFTGSTLRGGLTAFYANAVTLKSTSLTGGVVSHGRPGGLGQDDGMPNNVPMSLKIITGSRVTGALDLHGTRLGVSRSTLNGAVTGGWNHAVSLTSTTVRGRIELTDFREGAFTLCGDTVTGDVSVNHGSYGAFVGQTAKRVSSCRGNTLKGALAVNDMLGVRVRGNVVSGLASGINPAFAGPTGVMGSRNTFRGGTQGDFTLASLQR